MGGRTGVESCAETRWESSDWDSGSTGSPDVTFSHTRVSDHRRLRRSVKPEHN